MVRDEDLGVAGDVGGVRLVSSVNFSFGWGVVWVFVVGVWASWGITRIGYLWFWGLFWCSVGCVGVNLYIYLVKKKFEGLYHLLWAYYTRYTPVLMKDRRWQSEMSGIFIVADSPFPNHQTSIPRFPG